MINNKEVLESVGERQALVKAVVKRKKNLIGHVVRREGLLRDVFEGRMESK